MSPSGTGPVLEAAELSASQRFMASNASMLAAENNAYDNEIYMAFGTIDQERSILEREREHNRQLVSELEERNTQLDLANHERTRLEILVGTLREDLATTRRMADAGMGPAALQQTRRLEDEIRRLQEVVANQSAAGLID